MTDEFHPKGRLAPHGRVVAGFVALAVVLVGAAITGFALRGAMAPWPVIGIDDANITQAYARHIAEGHGYVYNIGSERVEGSTSLLWTGLNVLAFRFAAQPELALAALSALLTFVTVYGAIRVAQSLSGLRPGLTAAVAGSVFLLFPGFFAWMVWSLMDTPLWVAALTLSFAAVVRRWHGGALVLLALALPVIRPEGVAVTIALALFLLVNGLRRDGWRVGVAGLLSLGGATLWRLWYFGLPVPNTFYAKTSTAVFDQVELGARYVLSYLIEPQNAVLVAGFCVSGALILMRDHPAWRRAYGLALYLILGGALVYVVLGGDHFGAHRQYLYFCPLAAPFLALALVEAVEAASRRRGVPVGPVTAVLLAPLVLLPLAINARFVQFGGNVVSIEFSLAVEGRAFGDRLNALPGAPTIGVFAAGGLRMGYAHEVRDLLGLNWREMAHAPADGHRAEMPNQHGFNSDVFWHHPPDVFPVFPATGPCPETWQPMGGYLAIASDDISRSDRFRAHYDLFCDGDLSFYAARDYVEATWDDATRARYARGG